MYTYEYPRPAVAVDCVIFGHDHRLYILLVKRRNDPYKDCWALPGGFLEMEESCEEAAARELEEETGLKGLPLQEVGVFSALDRDPRGRVISVAYCTQIDLKQYDGDIRAGSDAGEARWFSIDDLPVLAFDHETIIMQAIEKVSN